MLQEKNDQQKNVIFNIAIFLIFKYTKTFWNKLVVIIFLFL